MLFFACFLSPHISFWAFRVSLYHRRLILILEDELKGLVQSVKCLLCEREKLILCTHIKKKNIQVQECMPVMPSLGWQRQEDLWSPLVSLSSQIIELQVQ